MTAVGWLAGLALAAAALAAEPVPLLVFVPGAAQQWTPDVSGRGWELAVVAAAAGDAGVRSIETAVSEASARRAIDRRRIYLFGVAEGSAAVFYAISRRPDLWAAAVAAGGNPRAAIETNRLFGANAQLVPLLWAVGPQEQAMVEDLRTRLRQAGFQLEPQRASGLTGAQALDWLSEHVRDEFPEKIDCETGSPAFPSCYWLTITRFDPAQRNDVLPSSRVAPGSGAALALGGFGYKLDEPGPGLLVTWLAPDYKGPLKLGDRIVEIGGKPISDPRHYVRVMEQTFDEKRVAVMVQRGGERLRIESRIVLPKREENVTARVQAQLLREAQELLIVSRGVAGFRIDVPPQWTPCAINWNGNTAGTAVSGGCWLVSSGATAQRCGD